MKSIKKFIQELGSPAAEEFFGVSRLAVENWLRRGGMPLEQVQKAIDAIQKQEAETKTPSEPQGYSLDQMEKPVEAASVPTPVPAGTDKIVGTPDVMEVDPNEQNAGSMVRPGRAVEQVRVGATIQERPVEIPKTPMKIWTEEEYQEAMNKAVIPGDKNWAKARPPVKEPVTK